MRGVKDLWSLAFVLAITAAIMSLFPLATAFEFGDDEGFEVIKAFMCSKGYKLYAQIWNDQPPVSTVLLTTAFNIWGPSILVARVVAAGFGLLLIGAFHELIRARSGKPTALIATLLLLASPGVLVISVSVMLEVPAFAMALFAAWLLFQWGKRGHWSWLAGSGAAMAVALQIKLTAALVIPAVGIELLRLSLGPGQSPLERQPLAAKSAASSRRANPKPAVRSETSLKIYLCGLLRRPVMLKVLWWGANLVAVFALIGFTWGKGALASSWKSHTGAQGVPGFDRPEDHKFELGLLWNHFECVIAALVCIVAAIKQKRLREISFPFVLLLTVAAIHTVHRPWWNYYYLHLAIPLAWLAGWSLSEGIKIILKLQEKISAKRRSMALWKALALCGMIALVFERSERRLEGTIKDLRSRPSADANPIVKKMKESADRTSWVYSESGIYPFHARLRVMPELAIVMPKRFWSGQITTAAIIETCKQHRAELLVLPKVAVNEEWKPFLERDFDLASADKKSLLYIAKGKQEK